MFKKNILKEYTYKINVYKEQLLIKEDIIEVYKVQSRDIYKYRNVYKILYNYEKYDFEEKSKCCPDVFDLKYEQSEIDKIYNVLELDKFVKYNKFTITAVYYFNLYIEQIENKERTDLIYELNKILKDVAISKDFDEYNYMYEKYFKYYNDKILFYLRDSIYIGKKIKEDDNFEMFFKKIYSKYINYDDMIHQLEFNALLKLYNDRMLYKKKKIITRKNSSYIKFKKKHSIKKGSKSFNWKK